MSKVCVLGQTVLANLFGTLNPIGKWIRVNNVPFKVVGVLGVKGESSTGQDHRFIHIFSLKCMNEV